MGIRIGNERGAGLVLDDCDDFLLSEKAEDIAASHNVRIGNYCYFSFFSPYDPDYQLIWRYSSTMRGWYVNFFHSSYTMCGLLGPCEIAYYIINLGIAWNILAMFLLYCQRPRLIVCMYPCLIVCM